MKSINAVTVMKQIFELGLWSSKMSVEQQTAAFNQAIYIAMEEGVFTDSSCAQFDEHRVIQEVSTGFTSVFNLMTAERSKLSASIHEVVVATAEGRDTQLLCADMYHYISRYDQAGCKMEAVKKEARDRLRSLTSVPSLIQMLSIMGEDIAPELCVLVEDLDYTDEEVCIDDWDVLSSDVYTPVVTPVAVPASRTWTPPRVADDETVIRFFTSGEELARHQRVSYSQSQHGVWADGYVVVFPDQYIGMGNLELDDTEEQHVQYAIEDRRRSQWLKNINARLHPSCRHLPDSYVGFSDDIVSLKVPTSILDTVSETHLNRDEYEAPEDIAYLEMKKRIAHTRPPMQLHVRDTWVVCPQYDNVIMSSKGEFKANAN